MFGSREMRRLTTKWTQGNHWPKRLEWLEIKNIRGWTGHRIEFKYPITAIVGENGSGKSTILQAAAASYRSTDKSEKKLFASRFFPDTPWDTITNAEIKYCIREGETSIINSVKKPTDRWRGNPERRERKVYYIDLSRIQPLSARSGYSRIAKATLKEGNSQYFAESVIGRLSTIMGKSYKTARLATAQDDPSRFVPVIQKDQNPYSGFHQGAGELTATELLANEFEKYSLVIIDEIESSLHPRAQRRLIRDLANIAREKDIQFIISTHSPYVLEEIPTEGRIYIVETDIGKSTVIGVSPEFAMSKMDEENHPECDVYVEDDIAAIFVKEISIYSDKDITSRILVTPFGAASVGISLGQMVSQKRFPRPSVVFLDGDQTLAAGVLILPGNDAPEHVVFESLCEKNWPDIATRLGREPSEVIDALNKAMTLRDHHEWLTAAANPLFVGTHQLWQALCASWVHNCASQEELDNVILPIKDALEEKK
ncbi:ATP-dependent nuclease [Bilophila wadsworthia]|uniref:ATP-dependent nuclease n=1 Tax=Bilophila wadsworthia TaxID=35833 RepID=UPI0039F5B19F